MAKQTNTPEDWRLLAERDMSVADHLASTMTPVPIQKQSGTFCKRKSPNCFNK